MAGINSDHMEAAIITLEVKPKSAFFTLEFILLRIRKTMAAPRLLLCICSVHWTAAGGPLMNRLASYRKECWITGAIL